MLYSGIPKTVDDAVERLISDLSLNDKAYIARLERDELYPLHITFESRINQDFGMLAGNRDLLGSCRLVSGNHNFRPEDGVDLIVEALWRRLRKTHAMRLIRTRGED
jgi:hypothetical protein